MIRIDEFPFLDGLLRRMIGASFGLNSEKIHENQKYVEELEKEQLRINEYCEQNRVTEEYINKMVEDFNKISKPYKQYYLCEVTIGQIKKLLDLFKEMDKKNEYELGLAELPTKEDDTPLFYLVQYTLLRVYEPKENLNGVTYTTYEKFNDLVNVAFFEEEHARIFIRAKVLEEKH